MNTLDRRQVLLGSGLMLGLTGCESISNGTARMAASAPALGAVSTPGPFEENWHYGDRNPKFGHPTSMAFDPPYAALLHLNLNSNFEMEANRVHFKVKNRGVDNTFRDNSDRFAGWINFYNRTGPEPLGYEFVKAEGDVLDNFAFNDQHHVLIYIKNSNIGYDQEWPIWFGRKLVGSVYGIEDASENHSFFGISPKALQVTGGSVTGIYLKNHYSIKQGNVYRRIVNEKAAYSMNINARAQVAGFPGHVLPIIIDPDTGNMGEGSPLFGT